MLVYTVVGMRQGNHTDEWLSMLQREAKQHDYYKTSISTAPESRHIQPTSHHGTGRNNATGVKSLATRLSLVRNHKLVRDVPSLDTSGHHHIKCHAAVSKYIPCGGPHESSVATAECSILFPMNREKCVSPKIWPPGGLEGVNFCIY
jgi:hypothetical protein